KCEPADSGVWLEFADALEELERWDAALTAYARAGELDPNDERAWWGRGNILSGLSRFEDAVDAFRRAVALVPEDESDWKRLADVLCELGTHQEALEAAQRANELADYRVAALPEARALMGLGRHAEALEPLFDATDSDSGDPGCWRLLAAALDGVERKDEAREARALAELAQLRLDEPDE